MMSQLLRPSILPEGESLLTVSTVWALMQKQKKPPKIQKETNKNPKQTKQTKSKPANQTKNIPPKQQQQQKAFRSVMIYDYENL